MAVNGALSFSCSHSHSRFFFALLVLFSFSAILPPLSVYGATDPSDGNLFIYFFAISFFFLVLWWYWWVWSRFGSLDEIWSWLKSGNERFDFIDLLTLWRVVLFCYVMFFLFSLAPFGCWENVGKGKRRFFSLKNCFLGFQIMTDFNVWSLVINNKILLY